MTWLRDKLRRLHRRCAGRGERGYTMLIVLGMLTLSTGLVGAVLTLTSNNANNVSQQVARSKAYDAAQAGVGEFLAQLNQQPNLWLQCPTQSTPQIVDFDDPNHVADFSYADGFTYSVIPAYDNGSSASSCVADNVNSILDTTTNAVGQFRMLFTGYAGPNSQLTGAQTETRNLVVSFSRTSLDQYLYFSNYEVLPSGFTWYPDTTAESSGCNTYYRNSRSQADASAASSAGSKCLAMQIPSTLSLPGPIWTNDTLDTCSNPALGLSGSTNVIEAYGLYCSASGTPAPSYDGGSGSLTTTGGTTLTPPSNNSEFASEDAGSGSECVFAGAIDVKLAANNSVTVIDPTYDTYFGLTVGTPYSYTCTLIYDEPTSVFAAAHSDAVLNTDYPCNSDTYAPSGAAYDDYDSHSLSEYDSSETGCPDAYVNGTYNTSATIATAGDIVIDGPITNTASSTAVLGLAATNWVRLYHPMNSLSYNGSCTGDSNATDPTGTGPMSNATVDAAILAENEAFTLDNYHCGASLGTLTLSGSIAQNYHGPISYPFNSTTVTDGYAPSFSYDTLLQSVDPPDFPTPSNATWTVARETLCYDGAACATAAG